ncbi:MAG: hypothetical protein SP1CHLAM54_02540 [Chlamydiia bacterium]|nr:hypothetical protein [Chlamydiia bacterium]MCH9615171.1 hypothetical protein [Chlamydiia bacterium]MCH9628507.1 hypothetical protein [Chlamydiia bacterium]
MAQKSQTLLKTQVAPGPIDEIELRFKKRKLPALDFTHEPAPTVFMAAPLHKQLSRFFFHMMHTFCIPGKRIEVKEFSFHQDRTGLSIGYAKVVLEGAVTPEHFEWIKPELLMGLTSSYHAMRVLEMQGVPAGDKPMLVHERLSDFIHRFPEKFDFDLFALKQTFFNSMSESFKNSRRLTHLSRLIISAYAMRRKILSRIEDKPRERHLLVKALPASLNLPLEEKSVMGILVGAHLMKEREVLGKRHLINTIRRMLPGVKDVEGSSLEWREGPIRWIYLEIEKDAALDKTKLTAFLGSQLKNSVEKLMRSVFMPRNEEEVMKNLVLLSHQIKFVGDLPQVIISFEGQTESELLFNVALVRLLRRGSVPYEELPMHVDRRRLMGKLRKRHPKEALVLRVNIKAEPFLREDQSIDLLSARVSVVGMLESVFGEVRDFNGGMFSKQNEAMSKLKRLLVDEGESNQLTIENFFHAIRPIEMQACVRPDLAKKLFLMMKASKDRVSIDMSHGHTFIVIQDLAKEKKLKISSALSRLGLRRDELVTIQMSRHLGIMAPKKYARDLLNTVQGFMMEM